MEKPPQVVSSLVPAGAAPLYEADVVTANLDSKKTYADIKDPDAIAHSVNGSSDAEDDDASNDGAIIITGADAARHLLPLRDDFQNALTFRSIFLATGLSAFQAVMTQIYQWKPTPVTISGTFIVLIAWFIGGAWAKFLPRGDVHEARWRSKGGTGALPMWIRLISFFNYGPWNLKEHTICAITATSASNASQSITVFAAQKLFYDLPLNATTVILTVVSIGLFGYGLTGLFRPACVWHEEAVYWGTLPTVKTLQGLHWQQFKSSKPLRWFWYSFIGMFCYEFLPAYIFPWLNSVSIPCLAAMHATGSTGQTLTRFFGGATNNEGLGLFTLSFDWQYITSFNTSLPLKLQANSAAGLITCAIAMIVIYYSNAWGAKSLPFMSTRLQTPDGTKYPVGKVFKAGILDEAALAEYGIPELTGSFAYSMLMANAAIGALIMHVIIFWGGDVVKAYKDARKDGTGDRHHQHMTKHYKEVPWWWYVIILVVSFVLGVVVIVEENITLPVWAYIVALLLGSVIAPMSCLLYSRFGNGIATNNLSKMIAGFVIPGRPVGNMYFAAWSHEMISNCVNLANDLKMGEYLKIPPRVMFLTQIWGTIFGGFINYIVMISIVKGREEVLSDTNGDSTWSGATIQSYNTNAASWALSKYMYSAGSPYWIVPVGMALGSAAVIVHRIFVKFIPQIRGFSTSELNLPQFIQYAGYIPYNANQTCVILSQLLSGFFTQFYLRNYRPNFFKNFSYLVTGAFDGGALFALFLLSFAVFGAGGKSHPFPAWWGNNVNGNYDHCPADS